MNNEMRHSYFLSIIGMTYLSKECNQKLHSLLGILLLIVQIFYLEINTSLCTGAECTYVNLA